MNKQIEALKIAIEYLMVCHSMMATNEYSDDFYTNIQNAIDFGKEALADAENPELVAVQYLYKFDKDNPEMIPLYTHPATWQSLSDDEIFELSIREFTKYEFARAIEQALKEKNHV